MKTGSNKPIIEKDFKKFNPRDYLNEYYDQIGSENNTLLLFLAETYTKIPQHVSIIEFGGGPTLYQLISAATKAKEIYFCDYVESNLEEVRLWKNHARTSFNWDQFFEKSLVLESNQLNTMVSSEQIEERKDILSEKLTKIFQADAFQPDPLGVKFRNYFDVLSSHFVAEGITTSKQEWKKAVKNMCSLIKPGGFLITNIVKNSRYWHVGDKKFLSVKVDEDDIYTVLVEIGFDRKNIYLSTIPAEVLDDKGKGGQGYDGIISVFAKKNKVSSEH